MIPYGLARFLNATGPYLLQGIIMKWAGSQEAGRFYLIASAAIFIFLVADLGATIAFPVLFGSNRGRENPLLADILLLRLVASLSGVVLFALFCGLGFFGLRLSPEVLLVAFYVVGRNDLASRQGFLHARQEFGLLVTGAGWHMAGCIAGFAAMSVLYGLSALTGITALFSGVGAEWLALRWWSGQAFAEASVHPPGSVVGKGLAGAFRQMLPYSLAGLAGALYSRSDALIGSWFLSHDEMGIYGTLDAAFRLAHAPSNLSAQAAYPSLNAAREAGDRKSYVAIIRAHLMVAGFFALVAVAAGLAWARSAALTPATGKAMLFFLLAVPIACPNSLVVPHYFPQGLERVSAAVATIAAGTRPLSGALLVHLCGMPGLAVNYFLLDLVQMMIYWFFLPFWFPEWYRFKNRGIS